MPIKSNTLISLFSQSYVVTASPHPSRGTAIIEASLILIVLIGLFGAIIYYALFFNRYAIISYALTSVTKQACSLTDDPTYPNPTQNYSVMTTPASSSSLGKRLNDYLLSHYFSDITSLTVTNQSICQYAPGFCRLRISVQWAMPCILCTYLKSNSTISLTSDCFITDAGFNASSLGCLASSGSAAPVCT